MIGWINRLRLRLRALFRPDHHEELQDEMRLHLEFLEDEYRAAGMDAEEARTAARRQFGNATRIQEQSRELFSFRIVEDLARDVSLGMRAISKSPGFALVAISALAIGAGANITVFGFVNAMLLRPLDVSEPERLIRAYSEGTDPSAFVDYRDYLQYRDHNQSLSNLAMSQWGGLFQVQPEGLPARMIHAMPVSGNYFETLGVVAALGRAIAPHDDQPDAANVVVLSDACWRRYYAADPEVIGRPVFLNRMAFTVIGVLPPSFQGTDGSTLIPMHYIPWKEFSGAGHLIGRLKPGIPLGEAQADLSRIATQLSTETGRRTSIVVYPAGRISPLLIGQFSLIAVLFMLVVGVVLLIACDNIAILLLTRWAARRREIGIRLALGASRFQLVRQLLAENLLLSGAGGICALGAALWTARLLTQFTFPVPMPHGLTFDLDWRVVAFAIGLALATTLLFGLGPALQSAKTDVLSSIKEGGLTEGAGGLRIRAALVATQIAMCTTLLVVTAVLVRSLEEPMIHAGFSPSGVLMATVSLPAAGYTPETAAIFYERMLLRFETTEGVASAAVVENIPLMPTSPLSGVEAFKGGMTSPLTTPAPLPIYVGAISGGHFRTLNIPLLEGRDFTGRDDARSAAVGIANETLARRFWPGESAIGKRLRTAGGSTVEVVGVARDIKYESIDEEPKAFLYRPLAQQPAPTVTFLIKTAGDPIAAVPLVRAELASIDPNLLAYNLNTLEERIGLNLLPNRAAAVLGGILGILALGLSAIGTYGAMAFVSRQRSREIGIRIALGAQPSNVVRLVTRQGMILTGAGLAFGLTGALGATAVLRRFLYGVSVFDPVAFSGITALLAAIAYLACYVPAKRASHVDPIAVLHDN